MKIKEIAILPPLAFARFGSSKTPVDNYTLASPPNDNPLGYRRIAGERTLIVEDNGEITEREPAEEISFKEEGADGVHQVRPVAPYFEVWAEFENGNFAPLTEKLLGDGTVEWCVELANRKVYRRTQEPDDIFKSEAEDKDWIKDHEIHEILGKSPNFIDGRYVVFGHARCIKPNEKFPEIRLRFTPAAGLIYGSDQKADKLDESFIPDIRRIYKSGGGPDGANRTSWWCWQHDQTNKSDIETIPPSLFAIFPPAPPWLNRDIAISRGYLDDACDGFVRARLKIGDKILEAKARIGVAPPHYAPDSLFVRNLVDDLEQALVGVSLTGDSRERALDVVRRAFETVRFMNVAVMNGSPFKERDPLDLDTMPAEEAFGTERPLRAVFSPPAADTRAVAALHQRVYAALTSGSAGWFDKLLRRPEEIGDLTDSGRRKMPALMSSAESYYLALTRRQISAIENIGGLPTPAPPPLRPTTAADLVGLRPRNHTAELMYKAAGNPISSHPITAISNCCPGLEFDFRAVWRRLLVGITLVEHTNLVVETEEGFEDLRGRRLLKVDGHPVLAKIVGPRPSDPTTPLVLLKEDNPDGMVCMEWSNNFARILGKAGEEVACVFSHEQWAPIRDWPEDIDERIERKLKVRNFFEPNSAVISEELAVPGELTQGLCSPWQNDFRECSCYYWASSRPDYVNVTMGADGMSRGDNWMQKERTGDYIADDYQTRELIVYDDLFVAWETLLKFEVGGKDYGIDAKPAPATKAPPPVATTSQVSPVRAANPQPQRKKP